MHLVNNHLNKQNDLWCIVYFWTETQMEPRMSTDLQILDCLLSHLRPRRARWPNGCQVGGGKLKVFGVRHQVEVKAGSPLSIPQHRLHRLQSAGGILVTVQLSHHHLAGNISVTQHQLGDKSRHSWFRGQTLMVRSPSILWNDAWVLSLRHRRALRSVGRTWLVPVSPRPSVDQRDAKSQPDSASACRSIHSRSFQSEGKETHKVSSRHTRFHVHLVCLLHVAT